jgi:hypothetical protein
VALVQTDLAALPGFDLNTKKQDPRYEWFLRNVGTDCCELDALSPPDLRGRVEAEIGSYIDRDKWARAIEVEAAEIASMKELHKSW